MLFLLGFQPRRSSSTPLPDTLKRTSGGKPPLCRVGSPYESGKTLMDSVLGDVRRQVGFILVAVGVQDGEGRKTLRLWGIEEKKKREKESNSKNIYALID